MNERTLERPSEVTGAKNEHGDLTRTPDQLLHGGQKIKISVLGFGDFLGASVGHSIEEKKYSLPLGS